MKINECIAEFNKEHNENFKIKNFVIFKLGQEQFYFEKIWLQTHYAKTFR